MTPPELTLNFSFAWVEETQKPLLHSWLKQDHIKEWLHGQGLQNTLNDLENFFKCRDYLCEHWIAYINEKPFGYLITSEVRKDVEDDAELSQQCQKDGRAITLDLFICDPQFLGKGLSVPMIQKFLLSYFADFSEVLIDPEATNLRAIHVYKKVGFKIIGEFIASWHPVLHYKMHLDMNDLKNINKKC